MYKTDKQDAEYSGTSSLNMTFEASSQNFRMYFSVSWMANLLLNAQDLLFKIHTTVHIFRTIQSACWDWEEEFQESTCFPDDAYVHSSQCLGGFMEIHLEIQI